MYINCILIQLIFFYVDSVLHKLVLNTMKTQVLYNLFFEWVKYDANDVIIYILEILLSSLSLVKLLLFQQISYCLFSIYHFFFPSEILLSTIVSKKWENKRNSGNWDKRVASEDAGQVPSFLHTIVVSG